MAVVRNGIVMEFCINKEGLLCVGINNRMFMEF